MERRADLGIYVYVGVKEKAERIEFLGKIFQGRGWKGPSTESMCLCASVRVFIHYEWE